MKIPNTFNISYIYWSIFISFCIFTLFTIENFQLPWGDEIFFVDISLNFNKTGKFLNYVMYPDSPREIKMYGPLYFWINAKLFSIFGLKIWVGRILNLLFGLLNILFSIQILKKLNVTGKYILLFLVFIITDVNYNFIMHSGRMDLVAVGFIFMATYIFFFIKNSSFVKFFLSGIILGIGVLFTSRLFLMLPLLLFYPLFGNDFAGKRRIFINLIFVFLGLISLYSIWIYQAYGGYKEFLEYYFINTNHYVNSNNSAIKDYMLNGSLFNKLFRNSYIYVPRYLLFYGTVFFFFFSKNIKKEKFIIFISLISLSFIILVAEIASEAYIGMVKPLIYIIIVFTLPYLFKQFQNKLLLRNLLVVFLVLIISTQSLFSLQKIAKIAVTQNELKNSNIDQKIKSIIPSNSLVMGGPLYFYDCKRNNCEYIFIMPENEDIKPDYIITKDVVFNDANYVLVSDLEYEKWKLKSDIGLLQKIYDITSSRNNYSSNAFVYKLNK